MPTESDTLSIPEQIIAAVIARAALLDGIELAVDVEDRDVPPEHIEGPVVVAYWRASPQTIKETGLGADVVHTWELRIYTALVTFEEAQRTLIRAQTAVRSLGRSESLLEALRAIDGGGVYLGTLNITDPGDEPVIDLDEGWMMKQLQLTVEAYEPGID